MGRFDLKADLFQRQTDLTAGKLGAVERSLVEIADLVVRFGGGLAVRVGLKEEELALGTDVEGVAHIGGFLENLVQHAARIAGKGGAVGIAHIADHARADAVFLVPRQHGERVKVGTQVLIGLLNAGVTFDGAAIEHDLTVDRLFDLGCGQRHAFELTEDIRELQAHKLDVVFPHGSNYGFTGIFAHGKLSPFTRIFAGKNMKTVYDGESRRVNDFCAY